MTDEVLGDAVEASWTWQDPDVAEDRHVAVDPATVEGPVVVKLGGARAVDPAETLVDVAHLSAGGVPVVLVHGGSTALDDTLEALGEQPQYVESEGGVVGRFTDDAALSALEMALPGQVNTEMVADLQALGVPAVGLSGVDGGLLAGPAKGPVRVVEDGVRKVLRGDRSGRIERVNVDLLELLLESGYVPVVTLPMLTDDEGPANADADAAAGAVAGALGATLVVLTDVPGVLADPEAPDPAETLIETVGTPAALEAVREAATGFMTRKVMAAVGALESGASAVTVSGADGHTPLLDGLGGAGTRFEPGAIEAGTGIDHPASPDGGRVPDDGVPNDGVADDGVADGADGRTDAGAEGS